MITLFTRRIRMMRADDGAALLLALLFIGVVGVMITALLPYTQTGISEASTARDVRSVQNAADGAIDGAIGNARQVPLRSDGTAICPTYSAPGYPTTVTNPKTGVTTTTSTTGVNVTCTLAPGTFSANPDVPPYAIITTKGDVTATGGNTLSVDGGMYVNGNIGSTGSSKTSYLVTGDAFVTPGHTCDTVVAVPGPACPSSPPKFPSVDYPSALGADSLTAQSTIDKLAKDPLGECSGGNNYVQFQPGYYSQIPMPDPTTCGKTPPTTYWFAPCANTPCTGQTTPGAYYLDFARVTSYDNYSFTGTKFGTWACCTSGNPGPGFWDLNKSNITLIGGTLDSNWQTDKPGHRCLSNDTDPGVQVILGGTSEISTGNGSEIEICASKTSSTSPQRIALYSLSSNATPPNWPHNPFGLDTAARKPTGPTDAPAKNAGATVGALPWSNRSNATGSSDDTNATATFAAPSTYGMDLSGFDLPDDGSLISDALVHVRHFENASGGSLTPQLVVHYADGSIDTCSVPSAAGSSLQDTSTNLMTDCKNNYLAQPDFRWKLFHHVSTGSSDPEAKISITYEVTGAIANKSAPTGTAALDSLQLYVTYVMPALDLNTCQDGSTACYAYSNSNSASSDNTFFIGSVYTPELPLNVVVHNNPDTIFQRGVVVSALNVNVSASSKQTDAPFELPHPPFRDRIGVFTARTTADNKIRLIAKVEFIDCKPAPACASSSTNLTTNQAFFGREVDILEWTVYH